MNKILSFITILLLITFTGCGNDDDKEGKLLENRTIDLSDFSVYVGSETGARQVIFNNLKNSELVRQYFGNAYQPNLFRYYSFRFASQKLTYIWGSYSNQLQIVSDYYFSNDSLFIERVSSNSEFVALGSNPNNIYRKLSLARYYNTEISKDTIIGDETIGLLDLDRMLTLRGFSSSSEMTNPTDTIIFCNVIYRFE